MLPPEIQIENLGNDFTYSLPRRPLGKLRWFGLIPVVLGAVFAAVPMKILLALQASEWVILGLSRPILRGGTKLFTVW